MMDEYTTRPHQQMTQLSLDEKKFLLAVERGDIATSRRYTNKLKQTNNTFF
jgi:transient receptor potential cation channel subfamily C protein 4